MAAENEVPAEVLRFLDENIDTVPQLETLLMMSQAQDRSWLVAEVAAHNYITEQRAEEVLHSLQRRGLICADESSAGFRFNPASLETRAIVRDLARYYQANLSRITTLIHSKPSASIKEFARAFDFKKDR
jgi:hypothetical protein